MRYGRAHLLVALLVVSSLASPRITLAAWPHNPGVNLPVCTATGSQDGGVICSDDAGGAIIAWHDSRNANFDIFAQHVLASGVADPAWPANGRALCTNLSEQSVPAIVADGNGGAIVAWKDHRATTYDVYAQHVLKSGIVDPAWPADGRALCTAIGDQQNVAIISDGAGGAIVSWEDSRAGGGTDIYAQHVLASGVVDGAWPADGRGICTAVGFQGFTKMVSDGAGGAIVCWADARGASDDIYAQHVFSNGAIDLNWPADGRGICTAAGNQDQPVITTDSAGGAIIAWYDIRGPNYDIYAAHVFVGGTVDNAWPFNGRVLSSAGGDQIFPSIVADGAGGAIVAWYDSRSGNYDIYANHVLASGNADPAWPLDGRALCTAIGTQALTNVVSDGSGGAVVAWADLRSGSYHDVYATHVLNSGTLDSNWPIDGRAVSTAAASQVTPVGTSDGNGGVILAWTDGRSGASDIYAQRVDRYGYLGTTEPRIAGVTDVPNDQGGRVRVNWDESWLDYESPQIVDHYYVFRQAPTGLATSMIARGARLMSSAAGFASAGPGGEPLPGESAYMRVGTGINASYWEYIAYAQAMHFITGYSYIATTTGDSIAAYNPKTQFMVVALDNSNSRNWASAPDSGYSTDDIPPSTPAPFFGEFTIPVTHLHWGRNTEADFANYRLYRGTTPGFVPAPGNRLASPPDTGYADAAGAPYFYKLSAVDSHGNESGFALLQPSGTTDVAGGGAPVLDFAAPWPNPARAFATLRFALSREGPARLAVYDAGGREVRVLADGRRGAGAHVVSWDLAGERGEAVPSGLYFVRFWAEGRTMVRRVAVMR